MVLPNLPKSHQNDAVYRPTRKGPAKVEPKTYFANERTFIQWLSSALMLTTISVWFLDFLETSNNRANLTAGIVLNSVSVFMVLYSIYLYYARLRRIQNGLPYGYVNKVGPAFLVASTFMGVVMMLYYYVDYNRTPNTTITPVTGTGLADIMTETTVVAQYLTAEEGSCFQRPILTRETATNGSPLLVSSFLTGAEEYEPSDILIDPQRELMLVPSLASVLGFDLTRPNSTVQTLLTLAEGEEADLEGITYVGDRIFAISEGSAEGGQNPSLLELAWQPQSEQQDSEQDSANSLLLVNRWELNFRQQLINGVSEGITFIPPDQANNNGEGLLYISGDVHDPETPRFTRTQDRGIIYTFQIPATDDTAGELTRLSNLNSNLINSGLSNSKISSLQYFQNILFVLHGYERIIRLWDIHRAVLLGETRLPNLEGNQFDQNWEGMFLERKTAQTTTTMTMNNNNNTTTTSSLGRRLRRTLQQTEQQQDATTTTTNTTTPLFLHLALNTPPEIWSFDVLLETTTMDETTITRSNLLFPNCAAVRVNT